MAAVTSPLSLSSDRTCHVIDTLVIIDYPRWYCYRFFLLCKNFCNHRYTSSWGFWPALYELTSPMITPGSVKNRMISMAVFI